VAARTGCRTQWLRGLRVIGAHRVYLTLAEAPYVVGIEKPHL
jgi:hypothetical protein